MSLGAFLTALDRFFDVLFRLAAKAKIKLAWWRARAEVRANPQLERLFQRFSASPEARWSIAANDVARLFGLVLQQKPKRILELGTGIGFSTAVLALALEKIGSGEIVSIEQLEKCIGIAHELIGADLKPRIRFIHAPPEIFNIPALSPRVFFAGYRWQPPPGMQFDFVLIDGPAGWMEEGRLVSLDCGDIFRLLPAIAPGGIVYVDGRRATVKKIRRYLGRYLQLSERTTEHAIFVRTAVPLRSFDELEIVDAKAEMNQKRIAGSEGAPAD